MSILVRHYDAQHHAADPRDHHPALCPVQQLRLDLTPTMTIIAPKLLVLTLSLSFFWFSS